MLFRSQEIESGGVCGEDVETFTEDPFEFRKARIVGSDEGAEVGVVGIPFQVFLLFYIRK